MSSILLALVILLAGAPAAHAAAPGTWNTCKNWAGLIVIYDFHASSDGRFARARLPQVLGYSNHPSESTYYVKIDEFSAGGRWLRTVDDTHIGPNGGDGGRRVTWALDRPVKPGIGRVISAKFTRKLRLAPDQACRAKDKV